MSEALTITSAQMNLLHKNLLINSNKQKSAQGSVYYVKTLEQDGEE